MTITPTNPTADTAAELRPVAVDLYRDIHKGIRTELFAVTEEAGRADPGCSADRGDLAAHVRSVHDVLVSHAEKEDRAIQPVLVEQLPALAERMEADHAALHARIAGLEVMADAVAQADGASARFELHHLYLELAAFASSYLEHQDAEERLVMPALEAAIGVEAVLDIHQGIVGSIPPDELTRSLAMMLPVMNVDDRTEMLGGIRQGAPDEVFADIWGLAGSVLPDADVTALATRLGL
jgi:hypothetical protein